MESVKALLRDFLDGVEGVEEVETERSSYFQGLLQQWLDIRRRDRDRTLLIYILGGRSEQYKSRELSLDNMETVHKISLQQGVGVYFAKMTSTITIAPYGPLEGKMDFSLEGVCDLSGGISGGLPKNRSVAVGRKSVLHRSMLEERYKQGTSFYRIGEARIFQDLVSLFQNSLCYSL